MSQREFTGQFDRSNPKIQICVGDLVSLSIPRKSYLPEMIVFCVVKEKDDYFIRYYCGAMSVGDLNYQQKLDNNVYKVIGNINDGINEDLLL